MSETTHMHNLYWPYDTRSKDIDRIELKAESLPAAGPGELICAVEAATICSSDIKVIKLGEKHPLLSRRADDEDPTLVLGHELCLRVVDVGPGLEDRYRVGQRLGLQPTIRQASRYESRTVGMDIPGGFAQYMRLGESIVGGDEPYVFEVPEELPAAALAMLEPYGCVERAYRTNARTTLEAGGDALIVAGSGAAAIHCSTPLPHANVTFVGAPEALVAGFETGSARVAHVASLNEVTDRSFDDIILCGDAAEDVIETALERLGKGGVLLQARQETAPRVVRFDPARVHYHALAFFGTAEPDVAAALRPERQRYEVMPGGAALVHGAGGPMGRIHVHRLLQLADGPQTLVATSRNPDRQRDIEADFAPLAERSGCRLIVTDGDDIDAITAQHAPGGFTDVIVAAPSVEAVDWGAAQLADDGMLVIFAGTPFGDHARIDFGKISSANRRITGATSCSVGDMQEVLARMTRGELDPTLNLKAVAGLGALGEAMQAMMAGSVSGKIAVYPPLARMPLTPVTTGAAKAWGRDEERSLRERWSD